MKQHQIFHRFTVFPWIIFSFLDLILIFSHYNRKMRNNYYNNDKNSNRKIFKDVGCVMGYQRSVIWCLIITPSFIQNQMYSPTWKIKILMLSKIILIIIILIIVDICANLYTPRLIPKVNDRINLQWSWEDSNDDHWGANPRSDQLNYPLRWSWEDLNDDYWGSNTKLDQLNYPLRWSWVFEWWPLRTKPKVGQTELPLRFYYYYYDSELWEKMCPLMIFGCNGLLVEWWQKLEVWLFLYSLFPIWI